MIEINWQNLKLNLHHSGAIFIEKYSMLLISDVHLGKVTHFRKHGAAVPQNAVFEIRPLTEAQSLIQIS